MAEVGRDIPN